MEKNHLYMTIKERKEFEALIKRYRLMEQPTQTRQETKSKPVKETTKTK